MDNWVGCGAPCHPNIEVTIFYNQKINGDNIICAIYGLALNT